MNVVFQSLVSVVVGLLSGYLKKLATKEFAHWVFFKIAQAIVDSTKTEEDNEWLEKIRETVEK